MNDWELLYLSLGLARACYGIYQVTRAACWPVTPKHHEARQQFIRLLADTDLPRPVALGAVATVVVVQIMLAITAWPLLLIGSMMKEKKAPMKK